MQLTEVTDRQAWDRFVSGHTWGHPLQLWGWGQAKRANGWTAHRLVLNDGNGWTAGVQVLLWAIPHTGRFVAYVPRGPVVNPDDMAATMLLRQLAMWAKANRVLYVSVEPAWPKAQLPKGWRASRHTIQLSETYTIDLNQDEDQLLAPMSRKHRQYIRKAERDGVTVERITGGDLADMYQIYLHTAERAGFGIHTHEYYRHLLSELGTANHLYYAYYDGRPVAFLWLAAAGATAYELYGGVSDAGQAIKANYLLKWRAITDMKQAGYRVYDFNGRLNDGVSQFKQGFGPAETNYVGTWDYPVNVAGYHLWGRLWPVAKLVGRRLAKARHR